MIFGLYEKILDSVLHFFKDIKKNFAFLLPIFLGAFLGVFFISKILQSAINNYFIITSYIFMGLILGSLPAVVKQANFKKFTFCHIMCFVLTLIFSAYLTVLEKTAFQNFITLSTPYLILSGFFMSAGIIIPGVSKTAILMMLGVYSNYLSAISSLNFAFLIPLGVGLVCGSFIFMYAFNFLFKHFKSYTYALILGFVVGSLFIIYPGFEFSIQYILGILLLFTSFFIAFKLSALGDK